MTSVPPQGRPAPGRQLLSRDYIAQHQRARIIAALAKEVSDRGYHAVTVADIVRRAGVSRNTFYENFASKEDCLLATQQFAMAEALRRVVATAGALESWPQRVAAGLRAFLRYVANEPELAYACMVEALAAGPESVRYYEESLQSFVSLFRLGRDVSKRAEDFPETLEEAIVGGVYWIVYQRLIAGEGAKVEALLPEIVEFALTPYLGVEEARRIGTGEGGGRRGPANKSRKQETG